MTDKRISELTQITGSEVDDASDKLAIVDASASETKAITRGELFSSVSGITTTGDVTVGGDLTVNGTTTTINTQTLDVEDKNITVAFGAVDAASANGAGLTVDGANATFTYVSSGDKWSFNKDVSVTGDLDVTGTITSDGLTVAGSGVAVNLSSNNTAGVALNVLRFTDTDLSADAGQELGKIEFYSSDLSTPGAGVKASIVGCAEVGNPNAYLSFRTDTTTGTPTEAMRITSTGNVGIGTSSPSSKLHLAASLPTIRLEDTDNNYYAHVYSQNGDLILSSDQGNANASSAVRFEVDTTERMRIDSSGQVGIGTSSPSANMHVAGSNTPARFGDDGTGYNLDIIHDTSLGITTLGQTNSGGDIKLKAGSSTGLLFFETGGSERMRIDASGNVGIGTSSPSSKLHLAASLPTIRLEDTDNNYYAHVYSQNGDLILSSDQGNANASSAVRFEVDTTERMRIDSSGNLLVGQSSTDVPGAGNTTVGSCLRGTLGIFSSRSGAASGWFNRNTSDGEIVNFNKDGTTVGSIGSAGGTDTYFAGQSTSWRIRGDIYYPADGSGNYVDNLKDIGNSNYRLDDIYATNGTIQTSDRNEKQDIAEMDEAERRVAVAAKGLIRKFRWKDAVAEKGDDARIHFGIIAQDLQAAFEAEGLDAGRYAMFISSTWWEADEVIPAVEEVLDDEGNVVTEAQPERTVTHHYETAEEAPEGAVERTRMGVRYPELLAFIIGAL